MSETLVENYGSYESDGELRTKTGFGNREVYRIDRREKFPETRGEAVSQILAAYRHSKWDAQEQMDNHELLGLGRKSIQECSIEEVRKIYASCVRCGMILVNR